MNREESVRVTFVFDKSLTGRDDLFLTKQRFFNNDIVAAIKNQRRYSNYFYYGSMDERQTNVHPENLLTLRSIPIMKLKLSS